MSAKPQQVALGAARAAGRMHLRRLSRIKVTREKTNAIDLVTEADQESEQVVIRTLNHALPDHAVLAEESGAKARRSADRREPKAAPPRNAPIPFGGKSLASAAVARADSRSRTESRGELSPGKSGEAFLPRRFRRGV